MHESLKYYQQNGILITAYSPLAHRGFTTLEGKIKKNLEKVAKAHDATIQQIGIAWLINHENVMTIPKVFKLEHVETNAAAADIKLTNEEIRLFYPEYQKIPEEKPHLIKSL